MCVCRSFCSSASTQCVVLSVIVFLAVKKQLEEKAEYTLKCWKVIPIKTWMSNCTEGSRIGLIVTKFKTSEVFNQHHHVFLKGEMCFYTLCTRGDGAWCCGAQSDSPIFPTVAL